MIIVLTNDITDMCSVAQQGLGPLSTEFFCPHLGDVVLTNKESKFVPYLNNRDQWGLTQLSTAFFCYGNRVSDDLPFAGCRQWGSLYQPLSKSTPRDLALQKNDVDSGVKPVGYMGYMYLTIMRMLRTPKNLSIGTACKADYLPHFSDSKIAQLIDCHAISRQETLWIFDLI